ncbi:MAG: aldo/keto reductase [Aureliella sp.]
MLQTNQLGNTGLNVTRLGFGSMGLRGPRTWGVRTVDEDQAEQVLHSVLDHGINFIDTSPDYGLAEERIGRYLSGRRSEFYIATKCGCTPVQHDDHLEVRHTWSTETLKQNIENSLSRLQTDRIDLLQFHGGKLEQLENAGLIDLLAGYRDQGVVGSIGISTKLPDALDHLRSGAFDAIQLPYSCLASEHAEAIEEASKRGLGVILRGGIAQGGPQADIQREHLNQVWENAGLSSLLLEGMSPAELILRYTLTNRHSCTTIVGTASLVHLEENVRAASSGPLPPDLFSEINRRLAEI